MHLLIINPGSTSTKIAIFENRNEIYSNEITYSKDVLVEFKNIFEQMNLRTQDIEKALADAPIALENIDCFVGRGGVLPPVEGGTYNISKDMLDDTESRKVGEHACSLACHIVKKFSERYNKPCYVVDPPSTDEVIELAKVTGLANVKRKFLTHALSQRGIGRIAAEDLGKDYLNCRLIVAHLGGGISIGAHKGGKIVDTTCSYHGEGPFTPERAGAIPALAILDLVEKGEDIKKLRKKITTASGFWDHLESTNFKEIEEKGKTDAHTQFIVDAMAYNISKTISSLLPALYDEENQEAIDALVFTGGMVYGKAFIKSIVDRLPYIPKVLTYPKTCEMQALAMGALRVLENKEEAKEYISPF